MDVNGPGMDLARALAGFDLEAQIKEVLLSVAYAKSTDGRYKYGATDRELNLLAAIYLEDDAPEGQAMPSDLPSGVREYVTRLAPDRQPARERQILELFDPEWEAKIERQAEERKRDSIEVRRRDRALIVRNRKAAGLAPLPESELPQLHPDDPDKEGEV